MPEPAPDVRVVAVVVSYQSDEGPLAGLLAALAPQVADVVVVDNGSDAPALAAVRAAAARHGAVVLDLGANLGIAAAQNRGIAHARGLGATHVLLSDDDSLPAPDMVARLVGAMTAAAPADRLAAVGPVTVDPRTGTAPLVFTDQHAGPRRVPALPTQDGAQVEVAFLIASGCLVDVAALDDVGGLTEELFIDHVDLEWGVRARRRGWSLRVVVGAGLTHALGDRTRRVPWRSRAVHVQSPVRNYYMVRNTLWLVRGDLFPARWRRGYLRWITRYVVYYLLAVPPRGRRALLMARGALDAARGRLGPLEPS